MRRGGGSYAAPSRRVAGDDTEPSARFGDDAPLTLTRCCAGVWGCVMACFDALFGCGVLTSERAAPSPPRLRRSATQTSGERLLPEGDAMSVLEPPPPVERVLRAPTPPHTPGGVALEHLPLPQAVEEKDSGSDDDHDNVRAKKRNAAVRDRPEECPMCLEDFLSPDNPPLQLACSHRFHLPCLLAWEQRSRSCPCCQAPMVHPALGLS